MYVHISIRRAENKNNPCMSSIVLYIFMLKSPYSHDYLIIIRSQMEKEESKPPEIYI